MSITIILKRSLSGLLAVFFLIGAGIFIRQPKHILLKTEFYVWQHAWTTEVQTGITRAAEYADGLMILAGIVDVPDERLEFRAVPIRWDVLSKSYVPVTLVFRIRTPLNAFLKDNRREDVTAFLLAHFSQIKQNAQENGGTIAGVQLDYDCPTAGLLEYRALLTRLLERRADWAWSITTLPTWLRENEFKKLVAQLSYFVLQVYSFESPERLGDDVSIIHAQRIPEYLRQAAAAETPFYIALPSYGYAVIFDGQGRFVSLEAETGTQPWPLHYTKQDVMAQPEEIAPLVAQLTVQPPQRMLGIVWFRLPVDGDQYNWSWPTLLAVMHGELPVRQSYQAEVRPAGDGLYEIWVTNPEHSEYYGRIEMLIQQSAACDVIAKDALRGFTETFSTRDHARMLTGSVPSPGKQVLAAWYRVQCQPETDPPVFHVSEVKALQ